MEKEPNYEEIFPIGAKVRFENEAFPGHWEYGIVECHIQNRFGECQWIKLRGHDDGLGIDYFADFDYRYLDPEPKHSLVRIVR